MKTHLKRVVNNPTAKKGLTAIIISLVVGLVILIVMFWSRIYSVFSTWFGRGKTEEEKAKEKALKKIKVDYSDLTITVTEAKQRAEAIYNGTMISGTDELQIAKQFVKKEYQQYVKYSDGGVRWYNPFSLITTDYQYDTLKDSFKLYEDYASLSNADYELIAKEFGVRAYGVFATEYLTMREAIRADDSGELMDVITYIMDKTQITF